MFLELNLKIDIGILSEVSSTEASCELFNIIDGAIYWCDIQKSD